jgi:hypothetical protein
MASAFSETVPAPDSSPAILDVAPVSKAPVQTVQKDCRDNCSTLTSARGSAIYDSRQRFGG